MLSLVLLTMLLLTTAFGTSVQAMVNTGVLSSAQKDPTLQTLSRITGRVAVSLREGAPMLRKIRESNVLSRQIFALKVEAASLREPLMQTIRDRIASPDGLTGDQLIALKDSIRILQQLRIEVRHLNAQLLEQRLAWRERRLAQDITGAAEALDVFIATQQEAVKSLESGIRVIHRIQEGL